MRALAFLLAAGLCAPALAQQVPNPMPKDGASYPFPTSFPTAAPTNAMALNVGSFPTAAQIPAQVPQALSVMLSVPASYTQAPWPATAISGYVMNNNGGDATQTAVALFGWAGQSVATPGTQFGMNVVVSNCAKLACAPGSGFANGNMVGAEIDVDLRKIGGATPIGQLVGLFITGDSEAVPSNGAYALRVKHLNPGSTLPWTVGYQTDDGAASTGVVLGTVATTGSSGSQPLVWKANNGSQIFMAAALTSAQVLEFIGNPTGGTVRATNIEALNAFRVNGIDAITLGGGCMNLLDGTAATLALCNTIPQNVYRNTAHVFQTLAGAADLAKFQAAAGAGSTGMLLTVNNAAGVNLANVTLGAADSGGVGFKALRVPN